MKHFFSFVGKIKTYNPCLWSKFFNKQNKVYHLKHIPMHCNLGTWTGLRLLLYFPLRLDLFPIRIYSNFRKGSYHLYNKNTLLHKIRLKRRAYKYYKKYPTQRNYDTYAKLRNQVKWESRKAVIKNEQRIALLAKSNPKSFFHYVSTKTKAREPVSNLRNSEGGLTETDLQKAEVLQSFFFKCFSLQFYEITPIACLCVVAKVLLGWGN